MLQIMSFLNWLRPISPWAALVTAYGFAAESRMDVTKLILVGVWADLSFGDMGMKSRKIARNLRGYRYSILLLTVFAVGYFSYLVAEEIEDIFYDSGATSAVPRFATSQCDHKEEGTYESWMLTINTSRA